MATKKPTKSKARKLTLRKETLKDLAPRARRAGQVKGGKPHAVTITC
jgi:hypothetical protein